MQTRKLSTPRSVRSSPLHNKGLFTQYAGRNENINVYRSVCVCVHIQFVFHTLKTTVVLPKKLRTIKLRPQMMMSFFRKQQKKQLAFSTTLLRKNL